jgi:hypothetical protein
MTGHFRSKFSFNIMLITTAVWSQLIINISGTPDEQGRRIFDLCVQAVNTRVVVYEPPRTHIT